MIYSFPALPPRQRGIVVEGWRCSCLLGGWGYAVVRECVNLITGTGNTTRLPWPSSRGCAATARFRGSGRVGSCECDTWGCGPVGLAVGTRSGQDWGSIRLCAPRAEPPGGFPRRDPGPVCTRRRLLAGGLAVGRLPSVCVRRSAGVYAELLAEGWRPRATCLTHSRPGHRRHLSLLRPWSVWAWRRSCGSRRR